MKNDVMPSIVRMDADDLKALLTEVKETVANDFEMPEQPRKFSATDMWNIRRNAKYATALLRR